MCGCWMTLECARLLKLHSSVYVAVRISYHGQNQTVVSYSSISDQVTITQRVLHIYIQF